MKLSQEQQNLFNQDGCFQVDEILSENECLLLKACISTELKKEWEAYKHFPSKDKFHLPNLINQGGEFLKILDRTKIIDVFSSLLGEDCNLYSYSTAIMPPAHVMFSSKIHVDDHVFIPGWYNRVVLTLAIDDFTIENGATRYLKGSHLAEQQPTQIEFDNNSTYAVRKKGAGIFFNPRVWHAGSNNQTDEIRYALAIVACRRFHKQRFDYHYNKENILGNNLSEKCINFIGLNAAPPKTMEDFYSFNGTKKVTY